MGNTPSITECEVEDGDLRPQIPSSTANASPNVSSPRVAPTPTDDDDDQPPPYSELPPEPSSAVPTPPLLSVSSGSMGSHVEGFPQLPSSVPSLPSTSSCPTESYAKGSPQLSSSMPSPPSTSSGLTESHVKGSSQEEFREDVLAKLRDYDTVILMDDSGSMRGGRWKEARKALCHLASIVAKYDYDGFDIHFLNHKNFAIGVKDIYRVKELFNKVEPEGYTPLGTRLGMLLVDYINRLKAVQNPKSKSSVLSRAEYSQVKRVNFLVITDGAPTDDLESVIVDFATALDEMRVPLTQAGIQLVQIGDSEVATRYLKKLDNTLTERYRMRDIVDTTPYRPDDEELTSEKLVKILLGGINRRIDNRGIKPLMQQFGW